jgi:hypothetical protein
VVLVAMLATSARAQLFDSGAPAAPGNTPPTAPPPAETTTRWYGGQLLVVDAGLIAIMAAGASHNSEPITLTAGIGWLVSGAVVHGLHHHSNRAAGSVAMRLVMPLVGGLIGSAGCQSNNDGFACVGAVAIGILLGAAAAEVIDIAIARDTVSVPPRRGLAVVPTVVRDGAGVGVAGRF